MVSEDVEDRRMAEYHGLFNQYITETAELAQLGGRVDDLADGLKELKAGADERLTQFTGLKTSLELSMLQEIEERRKTLTTARRKVKAGDFPAAYELLGNEAGEVKTIEEVTGEEFQGGAKYYANVAASWVRNAFRQASKVVTYPILGNADHKSRVWLQEKMGQEWFDEGMAASVSCWTNIIPYTAVGAAIGHQVGEAYPGVYSPAAAGTIASIFGGIVSFAGAAIGSMERVNDFRPDPNYIIGKPVIKEKKCGSLLGGAISISIRWLGESVTSAKQEARAKVSA